MVGIPDEILMRYADGDLDAAERARVDVVLQQDAATRARLKIFTRTSHDAIGPEADKMLREPVPQFLIDTVLASGPAPLPRARAAETRAVSGGGLASFLAQLLPTWPAAAAYAASVALAAAAGWSLALRTPAGQLPAQDTPGGAVATSTTPKAPVAAVRIADGNIFADGVLQRTLETAPSRSPTMATTGEQRAIATVRLSYRGPANSLCRQYDLTFEEGGAFSGIGCRTAEGKWQVQSHVPVPYVAAVDGRQAGPASTLTPPAIASIVEKTAQTMSDDEEKAALASSWQLPPH